MPINDLKYWQKQADDLGGTKGMPCANVEIIRRVVLGRGPDKDAIDPACGARVCANIAAVHVPAFCNPAPNEKAYKNAYDLYNAPGVGKNKEINPIRITVDKVLSKAIGSKPEEIYFCAIEINGSGVRFYGDMCFVMAVDKIKSDTVMLTSNSYDLARPPITPRGKDLNEDMLKEELEKINGTWKNDASNMAVVKVFSGRETSQRRLTTGQISDAVLDDEDYLEVLKIGSFDPEDLQEARVSAADTAAQGQIGEQLRLGLCPSMAELQWRKHRRAAAKALQSRGITTRVITTAGRVRT
jgi:hypothetical protein